MPLNITKARVSAARETRLHVVSTCRPVLLPSDILSFEGHGSIRPMRQVILFAFGKVGRDGDVK